MADPENLVPEIEALGAKMVEAEDSISQSQKLQRDKHHEVLRIAVLAYPRASNHTDFDVLRMHPQADCEFVRDASQFNGCDLMILPGSKHGCLLLGNWL